MGWAGFIAAFVEFFVLHSVPVRSYLVARLGQAGFGIGYSILSLVALAALFVAADRAPRLPLWPEPPGAHWLVLAAMTGASFGLAFGLFRPNPLSFGGTRDDAFDPQRPGLLRWVRHPVFTIVFLWSAAHFVANGDLAHAAMFVSIRRRPPSGGLAMLWGLPVPGQQVRHLRSGHVGQSAENVGQPSLGIDVVQLGGDDQGIHQGGALAAALRAGEEP